MSNPSRRAAIPPPWIADGLRGLSLNAAAEEEPNDFVEGYENPVAWHKQYKVRRDHIEKDVLFDNQDMKDLILGQYHGTDQPEYIKWKL